MTTALRAKARYAAPLSATSARVFSFTKLGKPNTLNQIEHRKGLDIQPFIFALVACLPDIDAVYQLGTTNSYNRRPGYSENRQKVVDFLRVLGDAGYGQTGVPYWVGEHGPTIPQIETIATTAEEFLDPLNQRYRDLFRANNIPEISSFQSRFADFQAAIEGLKDMDARRRYARDHRARYPEPKTALA